MALPSLLKQYQAFSQGPIPSVVRPETALVRSSAWSFSVLTAGVYARRFFTKQIPAAGCCVPDSIADNPARL